MLQLTNQREAYAAIVSLVLAADKVGTEYERIFLFRRIATMEPFLGMDHAELVTLFSDMTSRLFPNQGAFDHLISSAGMDDFCMAICRVLPPEQRLDALTVACELACVDGLLPVETSLLYRIGEGLSLSTNQVSGILGKYLGILV